ncbi:ATP-binding protein [Longirhabdus pacifica]|uniref:ATP-binding protein n=1 Tax=Longirhabdus pacifica TaxID=2305227 RepID=UPI0013E8E334|nr:ATP-binding protein [Longirhabdus pacifica]
MYIMNLVSTGIKDLLLQMLLVIFPVFVLQITWRNYISNSEKNIRHKTIGLFTVCGVILCLLFPVFIPTQYILDLSFIILIIAVVYSGYVTGLFAFATILLMKIFVLQVFTLFDFFNLAFVIVFCILFVRNYENSNRVLKVSFFTTLACLAAVFQVLAIIFLMTKDSNAVITGEITLIFFMYPVVSMTSIWMVVHLNENIREKQKMEMEIQRTERMNIIGHLAASVAHEIRNPMTVVRGFMQIFNKETFIPDNKKIYLQLMIEELDRAEGIINDYLSLARPKIEKQDRINVKQQIQSVYEIILSYAVLNNVSLTLNVEDDLHVMGIPEKVNQVLINLIKNSVEASPDGELIEIAAYQEEDKVIISVKDQGVGLTQEEIKLLGTPFYTTKENGTGLGLMVCYQIIKAMNGKFDVVSEKNKGTEFIIKLPAV